VSRDGKRGLSYPFCRPVSSTSNAWYAIHVVIFLADSETKLPVLCAASQHHLYRVRLVLVHYRDVVQGMRAGLNGTEDAFVTKLNKDGSGLE
jgi:hypothetical protein